MKKKMWAYMIQLSNNMWGDQGSKWWSAPYEEELSTDYKVWRQVIDFLPSQGFNTVLIDVGDAIQYETHPEISIKGAWSKDMMKQELDYMRSIGLTPIPKLNFSTGHDTWLKEYSRMVSTPVYYKVCEDLIKEVAELFGYPEYFHLGMNDSFVSKEKVKMDLFKRFGYIAAAGDRHLVEFCEGKWYLENPEKVEEMRFGLTTVPFRRMKLENRRERSNGYLSGEKELEIKPTGEEGVLQMRSLLGLCELTTNVNLPNRGQIPNLPLGAVVETNASFRADSLVPVLAGPIPKEIHPMVSRICTEQELVSEGIAERDLKKIFCAFASDPLVTCSLEDAKKLFREMCENTKEYLTMYDLTQEI